MNAVDRLRRDHTILRSKLDVEEAELFPILERTLAASESAKATANEGTRLDACMTVNRVVQQCPSTKPVFERLFINIPMEGCTCLDEVAWRHGMEARELLGALEEVIVSCACAARLDPQHSEADAVPAVESVAA